MDFLEKLKFLMQRDGYNKSTLSKACGIPYTTIDNWFKRGYDGLQLSTLRKLNSFFGTTLEYWARDEITDPDYGKYRDNRFSGAEIEHIKKYRAIDARGRDIVDTVLEKEYERVQQDEDLVEIQLVARSGDNETIKVTRKEFEEGLKILDEYANDPDTDVDEL